MHTSLLDFTPRMPQEEIPLHKRNIYAIVYNKEHNCLITGGEDMTIQLYYLNGEVPTFNDVPLPTCFTVWGPFPFLLAYVAAAPASGLMQHA